MRSLGRRCGFTVFVDRRAVAEKARAVEHVVDEGWIWERGRREEYEEVIREVDLEAEAARALNEGIVDAMMAAVKRPLFTAGRNCKEEIAQ